MNIKTNLNSKTKSSSSGEVHSDYSSESMQTSKVVGFLLKCSSQLKQWVIKQLIAHNERVSMLRVYQSNRQDKY